MPWYKSGLVSVALNSNAVIGAGTAFIANSRVGDAFRGPDGGWYEVTNIASDTALSISPNYQGATNAAGVYALAPMQGYVKDSADALRALVNTYGAKLAALGTTGNYDILPVSKGGTGGSTQAAAQTALDLIPQANLIDQTNNRVLKTGSFGIGTPVSATDANFCTSSGASYKLTAPYTNGPTAGPYSISVMAYDNEVSQLAFQEGGIGPVVFLRKRQGASTWGAWSRVAMSDANGVVQLAQGGTGGATQAAARTGLGLKTAAIADVLGATTQSGGVVTGALFNSGSNANGFYTFMADGTLICTHRQYVSLSLPNLSGAWYYNIATWIFPVAFIAAPKTFVNSWCAGRVVSAGRSNEPTSVTTTSFFIIASENVPASTFVHEWMAIGRWF